MVKKMLAMVPILLIAFSSISFAQEKLTTACDGPGGFLDLALSQVSYLSNDPNLKGDAWSLLIIPSCYGRYAVGEYSERTPELEATGKPNKQGFTIKTTFLEQTVSVPITTLGVIHPTVTYKEIWSLTKEGAIDQCSKIVAEEKGVNWFVWPLAWGYYLCIWETADIVYLGKFESITWDWTLKFEITLDNGQSDEVVLKKGEGNKMSNLMNFYVYEAYDVPTHYEIVLRTDVCPYYKDRKWWLAEYRTCSWFFEKADITSYDSSLQMCLRDCGSDKSCCVSCIENHNAEMRAALGTTVSGIVSWPWKGIISTLTDKYAGTDVYKGALIGDVTNDPYRMPVVKISLKADWVGIYVPVSKPDITKVEVTPQIVTERALIKIYVTNRGEYGCMVAEGSCDGIDFRIGPTEGICLDKYDSGIMTKTIYVSSTITKDVSCTVKVKDANAPWVYDTGTFSFKVAPKSECTAEGALRCYGDSIQICKKDKETGLLYWFPYKDCIGRCVEVPAPPHCEGEPTPTCGNGKCETGESPMKCPKDCPGICGDGYCNEYYENSVTCPDDCPRKAIPWEFVIGVILTILLGASAYFRVMG